MKGVVAGWMEANAGLMREDFDFHYAFCSFLEYFTVPLSVIRVCSYLRRGRKRGKEGASGSEAGSG